jgi:hypothetical protein
LWARQKTKNRNCSALQQEYADVVFLVLETLFNPLRITVQRTTRKLTMTFRPTLYDPVPVSIKPNFPNVIRPRRREAGIRFLDPPETARGRIQEWISLESPQGTFQD